MRPKLLPFSSEAARAGDVLAALLGADMTGLAIRVLASPGTGPSQPLDVPREALHVLIDALREMAAGNTVQVVTVKRELTTQEAADLLNVSRPYVVQLLERGKIPSRKVGKHRRVRAEDVLAFKAEGERR